MVIKMGFFYERIGLEFCIIRKRIMFGRLNSENYFIIIVLNVDFKDLVILTICVSKRKGKREILLY